MAKKPVVDLMQALEDSLSAAARAARCSAERPCATMNEMHLALYGECFVVNRGDSDEA